MITAKAEQERRLAFREVVRMAEGLINAGKLRVAYDMECLERMQGLENVEALCVDDIECLQGDYRNVAIEPDSVIYCVFHTKKLAIIVEWILIIPPSTVGRWLRLRRYLFRNTPCPQILNV